MLEYEFNDLDNDFVTLWLNYMLHNDTTSIMKPLRILAEKGQINAIQSWYILKKTEERSEIIDNIVDGYYGDSFNEMLAIANRIYDQNKQHIKSLLENIVLADKMGKESELNEDIEDENNEFYILRDKLISDYVNTPFAQQIKRAAESADFCVDLSMSALVYQRLIEIYFSEPIIFKKLPSESNIKNLRKIFKKRIRKNSDDIPALFSLGKNLMYFSEKDKRLEGVCIIKDLSMRPLKTCNFSNSDENILSDVKEKI